MENKIILKKQHAGKVYIHDFFKLISNAQKGKVGMFASPKGNVAIISWEKYESLVGKKEPKEKRHQIFFVDELANGGTPDEFFKELLNNKNK